MVLSEIIGKKTIRNVGMAFAAPVLALAIVATPLQGSWTPAQAQSVNGPTSVADLAEGLLSAVVNISTSQKVTERRPNVPLPKVPEGSPFQDFFDELLPNEPNGRKKSPPFALFTGFWLCHRCGRPGGYQQPRDCRRR